MEVKGLYATTCKGFAAIAGSFVIESLEKMVPWIIVMFAVITCDLITGCRRSIMMGEKVRFSRALRATMGKMITYFSFVVMVVLIDRAAGAYAIDKWAVLFVCFIEGCSIISNILKPKGYDFNVIAAIGVFCKKVFGIEKEDSEGIITKSKEETK